MLWPLLKFLGVDDGEAVIKDIPEAAWEAAQLDVDPSDWKHTFEAAEKQSFNRQCGELLKLLG